MTVATASILVILSAAKDLIRQMDGILRSAQDDNFFAGQVAAGYLTPFRSAATASRSAERNVT
jgi:hypothetical protein